MRVVHSSTCDIAGGAARAAYRLHRGLLCQGVSSRMFVAHQTTNDPHVIPMRVPCGILARGIRRLRRLRLERDAARWGANDPASTDPFTDDRSFYDIKLVDQLPRAHIVNLHWIARFFDIGKHLPRFPRATRIVWTLHDMNPFTGGCHYAMNCARFHRQCGQCPQLARDSNKDLSRAIWLRKSRAYQQLRGRLHIVAPSRWMAREAAASSLFRDFPITVIPNGVDVEVFRPRDQADCRRSLNLPLDPKIVLFVAESVNAPRKGFPLLKQALAALQGIKGLAVLSVGSGETPVVEGLPVHHLGSLQDEESLARVYNAADVFVIPSLQDNLPNTVMESMSCGTPVVGFDVGGISDMVGHGTTGLLVPPGDVKGLAAAIRIILKDPEMRETMSARCRETVLNEFTQELQANRYIQVYESLLGVAK